jgi:hypothetical protein
MMSLERAWNDGKWREGNDEVLKEEKKGFGFSVST